ncbi:MAG: ATP-binding protein [Chloroflexota bacterium]|nr:ATP-binding protein [Chloroflexota bacterium]
MVKEKKDWDTLIAQGESQTIEFKSDRNRLNDQDLINAIVCLANSSGGWLIVLNALA